MVVVEMLQSLSKFKTEHVGRLRLGNLLQATQIYDVFFWQNEEMKVAWYGSLHQMFPLLNMLERCCLAYVLCLPTRILWR